MSFDLLKFIPHNKANKSVLEKLDALRRDVKEIKVTSDGDAIFLEANGLRSLSTTKFTETYGGLMSKQLTGKEKEEHIKKYVPQAMQSRLNDCIFILTKFDRVEGMNLHFHDFPEFFFVIEGTVKISGSGKESKVGDALHIPPYTVHRFMPVTKGLVLTAIPKQ